MSNLTMESDQGDVAPLDNDDSGETNERPRKKQRKARPCYSCAECRRLKMKCDREVPCSNCLRRGRVPFCVGGREAQQSAWEGLNAHHKQQQNAEQTSSALSQVPSMPVMNAPPTDISSNEHQDIAQRQNNHSSTSSQEVLNTQTVGRINPLNYLNSPADSVTTLPSSAAPLYSIPTGSSITSSAALQAVDEGEPNSSHGTLMLTKGGTSRYLGPTAGSEWLKDSQTQHVLDAQSDTHVVSSDESVSSTSPRPGHFTSNVNPITFPFRSSASHITTGELLSNLPQREEAWEQVESYFRYCAWHHDVVPKHKFTKVFERVYSFLEKPHAKRTAVNHQEIALVFIVMAEGVVFNVELPMHDSSANDLLRLSEMALVKGDFLSTNTIAGLQTLYLMAHIHFEIDHSQQNDPAWPIWGLMMRLIQAMGMHRDGVRWNLPRDVVEERRKVFWECNATEIFQAHCFSRPAALNPEHCDTAFPTDGLGSKGGQDYYVLRFELSQLSSEILNMAMKVRKPPYSNVTELDVRLSEFEESLPFHLRCRASFLSMPSRYPQFDEAIKESPEPSRRMLKISFQQTNLALNISETVINLHRPYYAKMLYSNVNGDSQSPYAPSYFIVIERCVIIINIVGDIHARFPAISTRQWNFWYHVFGSALCLGTLVLQDPSNTLATFVLGQIAIAIDLFTSLIHHGASTQRYKRNLEWLSKLHARASAKVAATGTGQGSNLQQNIQTADRSSRRDYGEDGEELDLLGWQTRLIERAEQNRQRSGMNIHQTKTPVNFQADYVPNATFRDGNDLVPGSAMTSDSMNDLLHDFWDPMLLDIFQMPQN